jgi:hypothetical protein
MNKIKNAIDELQEQRRRNEAKQASDQAQMESEFKALTPMVAQTLRELGDRRWGRFPARFLRYRIEISAESKTWVLIPRFAFMLQDGDRTVGIRLTKRHVTGGATASHFQVDVCDERVPTEGTTREDLEQAMLKLVHWLF